MKTAHVLSPSGSHTPDVRDEFPVFAANPGLVYLDSAATSQKPQRVIDRLTRFYAEENANIHRGVYALSADATAMYDDARAEVAGFHRCCTAPRSDLHARHDREHQPGGPGVGTGQCGGR